VKTTVKGDNDMRYFHSLKSHLYAKLEGDPKKLSV